MIRPHRNHPLWFAYALHRFSGLAVALFLPVHFILLGMALEGEAALEEGLRWADSWYFKLAEFGLVFLLAVHLFGGLRLMALEWFASDTMTDRQKTLVAAAIAGGLAIACVFFLSSVS